jgi:hypothetical protein
MIIIWIIFLVLELCFGLKKTVYACQFLLISRILIPETVRLTPIADISLNTAVIGVLILFVLRDLLTRHVQIRQFGDSYIKYIFLYVLAFIIIFIFATKSDVSFQLNRLIQFCITDFIPVIIFVLEIKNIKQLNLTLKVFMICSLVTCIYGIFTLFLGNNPYVDFINSYYGWRDSDFTELMHSGLDIRRGFYTTSGTFTHANGWGYFLPIAFVLVFFYNSIKKTKIAVLTLILLAISIIICGKRTAIGSFAGFGILYFLLGKWKNKMKIGFIFIVGLLFATLFLDSFSEFNQVKKLVDSSLFFWNDNLANTNDIGGSNWQMRVDQMTYCFALIRDNLLFGKGFGWTLYYLSNFGPHPILMGFENIISDAVSNGGICGLLLWIFIFYSSYKYSSKNDKKKLFYILFTFTQILIALGSGLSYFIFYGIGIVLLNRFYLFKNDKSINSNSNIQLQKYN